MWCLSSTICNLEPTAFHNICSVPIKMEHCEDMHFKQCAMIEFLTAEKILSNIHCHIQAVYGDKCVDVITVNLKRPNVVYIKRILHSLVAECLMYQTPYMPEVFQLSLCLLEQETQTNHRLWVPRKGLAFSRSNDVIYGGPSFDIIYVHTWPMGISWGSDGHDTVDHCLRLKLRTSRMRALVSILAAFDDESSS